MSVCNETALQDYVLEKMAQLDESRKNPEEIAGAEALLQLITTSDFLTDQGLREELQELKDDEAWLRMVQVGHLSRDSYQARAVVYLLDNIPDKQCYNWSTEEWNACAEEILNDPTHSLFALTDSLCGRSVFQEIAEMSGMPPSPMPPLSEQCKVIEELAGKKWPTRGDFILEADRRMKAVEPLRTLLLSPLSPKQRNLCNRTVRAIEEKMGYLPLT